MGDLEIRIPIKDNGAIEALIEGGPPLTLADLVNLRAGQPAVADTLRVIADDVERGHVQPKVAAMPRANWLRRLARALEEA